MGDPAEKPQVIVAFFGHQTLGNFLMMQLVAASVARGLDGSKLVAVYRDDRPYKNFLTQCNPYVSDSIRLPDHEDARAPIDWFNGNDVEGSPLPEEWLKLGYGAPDVFLIPSMMEMEYCLTPPPTLRIPEPLEPTLEQLLISQGVDPSRWFVCLHVREGGYAFRRDIADARNSNPLAYLPMIKRIIEEQGGQVVRLGDPSMTALPPMKGLIDLSRLENALPLQAYAVSRARYFVATESGPTQIGCAFQTPTVSTNALNIGIWNDGDALLFKRMFDDDGVEITPQERLDLGMLSVHRTWPKTWRSKDNKPSELVAASDHMYNLTDGLSSWRTPSTQVIGPVEKVTSMPLRWRELVELGKLTFLPNR